MKVSKDIINQLCFKVALLGSSGTWVNEEAKFKCKGFIDALKWVLNDEELKKEMKNESN